jgi:hypothetical protein
MTEPNWGETGSEPLVPEDSPFPEYLCSREALFAMATSSALPRVTPGALA